MKSVVRVLTAVAIAAVTGLATVVPSYASPVPTSSSAVVDASGGTLSSVVRGQSVTLRTTGPVTQGGTVGQVLSQTIDPTTSPVRGITSGGVTVPDVTAPEGYVVEYNDGTAWSSTPPAYDATTNTYPTLVGVRATGSVTSSSYVNGSNQTDSSLTSSPVASQNFQGSSGGDGWDVFFGSGPAAGRVFNVYHHSTGQVGVDCHIESDGTACWGGAHFENGYDTAAHSTGFYVAANDSLYTFVSDAAGALGFFCLTAVSTATPTACATPFVDLTGPIGASTTFSGNGPGDAVEIGTKIYARGTASGSPMLCFDTTTLAPCASQPYSLGAITGNSSLGDSRLLAVGTDVYFGTGMQLGCFDTATTTLCAHFNGGQTVTASGTGALFYATDAHGAPTEVCGYISSSCWNLDGTAGTWPAGLPTGVSSSVSGGWGELLTHGTRLYYLNGNSADCYDFSTSAACTGFTAPTLGGYAYSLVPDPVHDWCMWSNSNAGQIVTFNPTTGASPCAPPTPMIQFSFSTTVPRLSCSATTPVSSWGQVTVTPASGLTLANVRVSVLDSSGTAVPGWQALSVDPATGALNLSALPTSATGLHPTFYVYDATNANPTGATLVLSYITPAPQLCTNVTTAHLTCPTGQGSGAANFPATVPGISFSSTEELTSGGTTSTENTTATVPGTLTAAECLATAEGHVYQLHAGQNPVAGITVLLLDPTGTHTLATTTTDVNGHYAFTGLYPGSYAASAAHLTTPSVSVPYQVGPATTTLADIVLPASAPTLARLTPTVPAGTTRLLLLGAGVPSAVLGVSGHCTVNGPSITFTTPGPCTITVTQNGTVLQSIRVLVTVPPVLRTPPSRMPVGSSWAYLLKPGTPAATSHVTGPCTVAAGRVYAGYPGTCTVIVSQGGFRIARYTIRVVAAGRIHGAERAMHEASVFFGPDSSRLTSADVHRLTALLPSLRRAVTIHVVAVTTSTSTAPEGRASARLSSARAVAVARFLRVHGVHVALAAGLSRLGNPRIGAASNRRADLRWW